MGKPPIISGKRRQDRNANTLREESNAEESFAIFANSGK